MRPQVMLMDLALPGIDGWEATRRIKAHPLLKQTVVIAVTAHSLPKHKEEALHAGCDAVVLKPYNLGALAEQVQRAVAQRPASGLGSRRDIDGARDARPNSSSPAASNGPIRAMPLSSVSCGSQWASHDDDARSTNGPPRRARNDRRLITRPIRRSVDG